MTEHGPHEDGTPTEKAAMELESAGDSLRVRRGRAPGGQGADRLGATTAEDIGRPPECR